MELNNCYRTKVDSETFAIPILTASAFISESTFVL